MEQPRRIGDLLVSSNLIKEEELEKALTKQKDLGRKIGDLLIEAGVIDEKTFLETLSQQINVPYIDLPHYQLDENVARKLPEAFARRFKAIVLSEEKTGELLVGMVDPQDIFSTDELYRQLQKPLKFALVSEKNLNQTLDRVYRRAGEIKTLAVTLASELKQITKAPESDRLMKQAEPAVLKLINSLFEDAVQVNASDIHIEPAGDKIRVRLRVDGFLQEQIIPLTDDHISLALNQRLKLMSGLNIAEKRLPQDGRFDIVVRDIAIDVRLSTMPNQYGESIVMRLLRKSSKALNLDQTGMPKEILEPFRQFIRLPHGIVLVTGPTGSGKTTTLYGALTEINDVSQNIITIEDPIEYRLERANQVQVNAQLGLSFARILRAALRQDPNIILVGEIRDQETASIALRAALTGHLVFATLHTNDAASTALRLIDIGVEGYLVAATLRVILAQRLVRSICPYCSKQYKPNELEQAFFLSFFGDAINQSTFHKGEGCSYCNKTGFKGRTGVFEILALDNESRDALRRNSSEEFNKVVGRNRKTPTLLANAFALAQQGVTTLSEVLRVAGE
ncbi:MAG: GspE/PulE family protein [Gammaproteobacteria bacterium]|nr:GspE/PulE family protein [Gammaproteobacteria bacterium]